MSVTDTVAPVRDCCGCATMDNNKKHKKVKQKPAKPVLEPLSANLGDGDSKFSRALGSTDYLTREQGLSALSRWLTTRTDVSDLEMLRLWKGLFFCFWHSDKVPVQTDLAERLAGLMLQMKPAVCHTYFSAFMATMRREWFNMDQHRVNKYLMLVRKFMNYMFGSLKRSNWSSDTIAAMTQQLGCGATLLPHQEHRSAGLTYHIADVWLPELAKVAGGEPLPAEAAAALLQLPLEAVAGSAVQAQVDRIRESVFEELLQLLRRPGSQEEDEEEGSEEAAQAAAAWGQLSLEQLAAQLFEAASQPQVRARNRAALYALHADLERLSGKKRKLGPGQAAPGAAAARGGAAQPQPQQQKQALKPQQQKRAAAAAAAAASPAAGDAGKASAGAGAVPSSSKKRKKQHEKEEGQGVPVQQQQQQASGAGAAAAATSPAAVPPSSTKSKKRKQRSAAAGEEGGAVGPPSAAAAAPTTPASAKQQRQQQQQTAGASPSTPAAAAAATNGGGGPLQNLSGALNKQGKQPPAAAAAAAKGSMSAPPKLKGGVNGNLAAGPATPAAAATPQTRGTTAAAAAAAAAAATTGKKPQKAGVRINLRQNLYFEHGAPPPAADVRTPPAAKPKGSALKKGGGSSVTLKFPLSAPPGNSKGAGRAGGGSAKGVGSGSAGQMGGKTQRRVVSPASLPRPRAAAFF